AGASCRGSSRAGATGAGALTRGFGAGLALVLVFGMRRPSLLMWQGGKRQRGDAETRGARSGVRAAIRIALCSVAMALRVVASARRARTPTMTSGSASLRWSDSKTTESDGGERMNAERHLDVWGEEMPATEQGAREASGEEILAAAVLRLAFEDLQKHRKATDVRSRRAFREAYVWVKSNE